MKFSIITITFNSEKTIERTLKSVLAQTYKDYEYIIVDGASKDSTMDIVRKYEPLFEGRMKFKSESANGIYDAMNKGVMRSKGDIIGIVNSDDWLEPNALDIVAAMVASETSEGYNLYCGSMKFHYEDGHSQLFESSQERFYNGIRNYSFNYGAYHPAIWVEKKVYEKIGLFDTEYKTAADIDFIYRCYLGKMKFIFTKSVLTNMSDGGVSNHINYKRFIADKKHYIKKYNVNKFIGYLHIVKYVLLVFVRSYMPSSLMKCYRDRMINK